MSSRSGTLLLLLLSRNPIALSSLDLGPAQVLRASFDTLNLGHGTIGAKP